MDQSSIERLAYRLFDEEWRRLARATRRVSPACNADLAASPLRWLLPELIRLVLSARHRPVPDLEPTIRRLIVEQDFVGEPGDRIVDAHHRDAVELYVKVFVRVLERIRQRPDLAPAWTEVPVTPQMFG